MVYQRPRFAAFDLSSVTDSGELKQQIQNIFCTYRDFLFYNLQPYQQIFAPPTTEFPLCMNDPMDELNRECIRVDDPVLYIYVPAEVARACADHQSLSYIPPRLGEEVLAMRAKPYDPTISVQSILKRYRHGGGVSNRIAKDDIEYFIAIYSSGRFGFDNETRLYNRRRDGSYDVPIIGRALFYDEDEE